MEVKVSNQEKNIADKVTNKEKKSFGRVILEFFKAPPNIPVTMDKETIDKVYPRMRLRIFLSCFVAYVVFYLCRKNISAALPAIGYALHYSNTQLGIIGSTLYATYSLGKFTNGVLADRSSIRTFLPTALLISAFANFAFVISAMLITPGQVTFFGLPSASVLLWILAFFWGCNGWVQSMGFPPIARSFAYWFSNNERGLKWSLWSTSHQFGTFFSVIMSGFLIERLGWKAAFYVPAIIGLVVSLGLFKSLRDNPTTMGLPDIEEYREPETAKKLKQTDECVEEVQEKYIDIFKKHILFNRNLWLLAVSFIFVYFTLMGTLDWMIKYLIEQKHNTIELATLKLSFLPLFGMLGTISAGYVSDKFFKCKRAPVNIIYLIGVVIAILALNANSDKPNFIDAIVLSVSGRNLIDLIHINGSGVLDFLFIGIIGFCAYGPQVLIGGLCSIESSSKRVASAATGFTGSFGYFGSILSGAGTGLIIDKFGWSGAVYAWAASALICILLLTPILIDEYKKERALCP